MSFLTGLQLLFIGLKLASVITWSWWLIMMPFNLMVGIIFLVVFSASFGTRAKLYFSRNGKKRYF